MKKVFSLSLIISVILISCFTEQPTKSEKLTKEQLTPAEFVNLIDKIVSGEIDEKQTQHIVSKLHSGKSYDNALKGLPPESNKSEISPDKFDINEVFERLDRIERNIKNIASYLDIEMDEKGRIIKLPTINK